MTSSTSFISFKLEEVAKSLTTGRAGAYWFMLEPLLMSKSVFDALPKDQRDAIMAVGADMEKFALENAKRDDVEVANVYQKAGAKVVDLNAAAIKKWQDIGRRTAWKDYGAKNEGCAKLLALAEQTL
jgi:TRAP-type C4-dicarboxylate transport system substrate-binding protein